MRPTKKKSEQILVIWTICVWLANRTHNIWLHFDWALPLNFVLLTVTWCVSHCFFVIRMNNDTTTISKVFVFFFHIKSEWTHTHSLSALRQMTLSAGIVMVIDALRMYYIAHVVYHKTVWIYYNVHSVCMCYYYFAQIYFITSSSMWSIIFSCCFVSVSIILPNVETFTLEIAGHSWFAIRRIESVS